MSHCYFKLQCVLNKINFFLSWWIFLFSSSTSVILVTRSDPSQVWLIFSAFPFCPVIGISYSAFPWVSHSFRFSSLDLLYLSPRPGPKTLVFLSTVCLQISNFSNVTKYCWCCVTTLNQPHLTSFYSTSATVL